MSFDFHIIKNEIVRQIIDNNFEYCFQSIADTYIAHYNHKAHNPPSYFLRFENKPQSRIIALPSYIASQKDNKAGIKWISSFPENVKKGFKRASSVFILNDADNGYPLACLESSYISAFRTASSAVLAAEYLTPNKKGPVKLGIIGTSFVAKNIFEVFMKRNWQFSEIFLYDKNQEASSKFCENVDFVNNVHIAKSLEELIRISDVILCTTTSLTPYINELTWFDHNPLVLNISLRDVSPEIIYNSYNYVDDIQHVLQANTSPHLAYQKYSNKKFITGTIAELLLHNSSEPTVNDKPTIFSPMGMGILDLAVASFVYDEAVKEKTSLCMNDFFGDISI